MIPPRAVAPDGWYSDLGAGDFQQMNQNQIRYNTIGDTVRNIASPLQDMVSGIQGVGEAGMAVAEKIYSQILQRPDVPQASNDALRRLAQDYANATNLNLENISNSEDYVTNSRAAYNDTSLCAKGLLLCSSYFLSTKKVCSNNVLDTSSLTGLRSVNIVEVNCENGKATVTNRWPSAAYRGKETRQMGDTIYFQGDKSSNYCVMCR